jgi:hypothetical protein
VVQVLLGPKRQKFLLEVWLRKGAWSGRDKENYRKFRIESIYTNQFRGGFAAQKKDDCNRDIKCVVFFGLIDPWDLILFELRPVVFSFDFPRKRRSHSKRLGSFMTQIWEKSVPYEVAPRFRRLMSVVFSVINRSHLQTVKAGVWKTEVTTGQVV